MDVHACRTRGGDGLGEDLRVGQLIRGDRADAVLVDEALLLGIPSACSRQDHAGRINAGGQTQWLDALAQDGAEHHAVEGAAGGRRGRVQVGMRVDPDDREILVGDGRDGTEGDTAVPADGDAVIVCARGDGVADALAHTHGGAGPQDRCALRVTGLRQRLERGRRGARQISGDRLGAVDELHRAGGRRSLPLRGDDETRHDTPVGRGERTAARTVRSRAITGRGSARRSPPAEGRPSSGRPGAPRPR